MKIKDVSYIGSYAAGPDIPDGFGPEFVFIGRSNVGKSSLINVLVGRKNLARTSNTPGKTRTANLYTVNKTFCFVDVPGYGYAQVSKTERARWRKLIADYLGKRESLKGIVLLLDIRHKPSVDDRNVSEAIHELGKPVCFVFNKTDKVKKREIDNRIGRHLAVLTVDEKNAVVPFSADTGAGKQALWGWINGLLSL